MKPLEIAEIQQIVINLQTLVGAQLQEVFQSGDHIGLGFYHERSLYWLWFDFNAVSPCVVHLTQPPKGFKKETKPLTLFVKAHFAGSRLKAVSTSPELGRVIELHFHQGKFQARLFPRGQNFIAETEDKSVSFNKLKELHVSQTELSESVPRSWENIVAEWKSWRRVDKPQQQQVSGDPQATAEKQFRRDLEKKEKALSKMREDLESKETTLWRSAGEYLKTLNPHDFPDNVMQEFSEAIDRKASLAENIEACFKKAKDNERKKEGTKERIAKIEAELNDLKIRGPSAQTKALTPSGAKKKTLLEAASARGRKLRLSDDLEVYIGKSAADNLALLRKAQPFDYWLHLRDYPGSHAIMRRTRNRLVSDDELQQVGKWVAQQSLNKSAEELKDSRFDVLLVECRFVRPIKGDKLGRVNYTNDRVFVVRF